MKNRYRIKIVEYNNHTKYYPQMKWRWFPLFWSSWRQVNEGGGMSEVAYSKREDAERMIEVYKQSKAIADKKPLVSYEEIL